MPAALPDYVEDMASVRTSDASGRSEISPDPLQDVAHRLREEFANRLDPAEVDECFNRVATKFTNAKVRSFVPLLVRRYVSDELQQRLKQAST
jgi:hypothetical protein